MKDISVKSSQKTETIDFGPVGRDILLDKKIEKETLRAQTKEAELEAAITTVTTSITDVLVDGQSVVENKVANIDSYHRTIVLSLDKIESDDPLLFNPSPEDLATLNNDKVETIKLDNQLPIAILPERSVWIRRTGIKNISGYGDVIIFDAESNNFRQNEDQSIELYKLGTTEVIYITSGPYANKCLILTNTVDVAWQLKRLDNFESDIADHRTQISQLWDKTAGMEAEYRGKDAELEADIDAVKTEFRGKDAQIEQSLADTKAELQAKDAELDNRIDSVEQRGRYLSLWNASTGLPVSDPASIPYAYKPGDYYIVKYVAEEGGINYRPDGSEYTGVASTVEETDELHIDNTYYYDGTEWSLQAGGASVIPWGKITGDIADQEDLSAALADKASLTGDNTFTGNLSIRKASPNFPSLNFVYYDGAGTSYTNSLKISDIKNNAASFDLSGSFNPATTEKYSLGTSSKKWANVYTLTTYISSALNIGNTATGSYFSITNNSMYYTATLHNGSASRNNGTLKLDVKYFYPDDARNGKVDLGYITTGSDAYKYRWNNIALNGNFYVSNGFGTEGQILISGGENSSAYWGDAPAPTNMVTTDTAQTISATKTFSVAPYITEVRVGSASGYSSLSYNNASKILTLTVPSSGYVYIDADYLMPGSTSRPVDLGMNINGYRFNNLHLAKSIVTPTGSGNAGQVLTSGGSDNAMTWSDAPSGGKSLYYHETQMTIDGTTYWVSVISTDGNSKASQLFTTAFNYQNFVHIVNIQPLNQLPDRCYIGGYRNNLVKKFICLKYSDNSIIEMNVNNVRITSDTVYEM